MVPWIMVGVLILVLWAGAGQSVSQPASPTATLELEKYRLQAELSRKERDRAALVRTIGALPKLTQQRHDLLGRLSRLLDEIDMDRLVLRVDSRKGKAR